MSNPMSILPFLIMISIHLFLITFFIFINLSEYMSNLLVFIQLLMFFKIGNTSTFNSVCFCFLIFHSSSSHFSIFFKHLIYTHAVICLRISAWWLDYCDSKSLRVGNVWTSLCTKTLMFIIYVHFKAVWKHPFLLQFHYSVFLFRLE